MEHGSLGEIRRSSVLLTGSLRLGKHLRDPTLRFKLALGAKPRHQLVVDLVDSAPVHLRRPDDGLADAGQLGLVARRGLVLGQQEAISTPDRRHQLGLETTRECSFFRDLRLVLQELFARSAITGHALRRN